MLDMCMSNSRSGATIKAVLLATGKEFNSLEVLGFHALVPLAHHPLLWYPLKLLEHHNFSDVHIICAKKASSLIQDYMSCEFPVIKPELHTVNEDSLNGCEHSSLEILRESSIQVDPWVELLIIPCDLIIQDYTVLSGTFNEHWRRNAAVTVLLSQPKPLTTEDTGGSPVSSAIPRDSTMALNPDSVVMNDSSNQLLYLESHGNILKDLDLPLHVTSQYPRMTIMTNVQNAHLFILKGLVFNFLIHDSRWSNLNEAVSQIISDQRDLQISTSELGVGESLEDHVGTGREKAIKRRHASAASNKSLKDSDYDGLVLPTGMSKRRHKFESRGLGYLGDAFFCCGFMAPAGVLCWRANSFESYMLANSYLLSPGPKNGRRHSSLKLPPKTSVGAECFIGADTSIGVQCKLKSCSVGNQCVINERTKIVNSVLMDNVTVGQGSIITNCLIGDGASIGEQVEIKDCIITAKEKIPSETKAIAEILPEDVSTTAF